MFPNVAYSASPKIEALLYSERKWCVALQISIEMQQQKHEQRQLETDAAPHCWAFRFHFQTAFTQKSYESANSRHLHACYE